MSTLQENLDNIKLDKQTNLKPENLKKGVTLLGVTGTMECGTSSEANNYNIKAKIMYGGGQSITTYITKIDDINTSDITSMNSLFYGCTNLLEIPELNTENVTDMGNMFYRCRTLTSVPVLNTSKVTSMAGMFTNCTNLITVPELDTSSLRGMNTAFENCMNLSDESLNNILAMCTKAMNYTQNRRLINIGLTKNQAIKCTTLSNYTAFTSAGWTTGY